MVREEEYFVFLMIFIPKILCIYTEDEISLYPIVILDALELVRYTEYYMDK
jgi:hypothetical protein